MKASGSKLHEHFRNPSGAWTIGADDTVKGGQDYCFSISKGSYQEGFGYNYSVMRPLLNGKEPDDHLIGFLGPDTVPELFPFTPGRSDLPVVERQPAGNKIDIELSQAVF